MIFELHNLSSNFDKCIQTSSDFARNAALTLSKAKEIFFLGFGLGEAVACEGALKMKELTYLHCQCFNIRSISNHFYNYVRNKPKCPAIWVVL